MERSVKPDIPDEPSFATQQPVVLDAPRRGRGAAGSGERASARQLASGGAWRRGGRAGGAGG
ncbi:MAG: hypothetical protein ACK5U4_20390, partial [Rhodospirillales bacterium]